MAELREIFARLKEALIPLVRAAAGSGAVDDAPLRRQLPGRRDCSSWSVECSPTSASSRAAGASTRPSTRSKPLSAVSDIRLTTRYEVEGLESLFSSMHEFGHGLYERQIAPELDWGPLAHGASLGWHESQSLLWENLIGRGLPFWEHFAGDLRALLSGRAGLALGQRRLRDREQGRARLSSASKPTRRPTTCT